MRLVKAILLVFSASAGCTAGEAEKSAVDEPGCERVLRSGSNLARWAVVDGEAVREGPCPSPMCLAGGRGVLVEALGPTTARVSIEGSAVEVPVPVGHVAIGDRMALAIGERELRIVEASGVQVVDKPPLAPGEELGPPRFFDDGRLVAPRVREGRVVGLALLRTDPGRVPDPRGEAARDAEYVTRAFYTRAHVERLDGTRVALPRPLSAEAVAAGVTSTGVVVLSEPAGDVSLVVTSTGAVLEEGPRCELNVFVTRDVVYRVKLPRIDRLEGDRWVPVLDRERGMDLAGAPLPRGTTTERLRYTAHDGALLVVERLRTRATCRAEDRLHLVDLATGAVKTLASGDRVRLHPTWAGDRFRYVEGDAVYTSPSME